MNNYDHFQIAIDHAIAQSIEKSLKSKDPKFWNTVTLVLSDIHFQKMIRREMKFKSSTWQEAVKAVSLDSVQKLRLFEEMDVRDFEIELLGSCKFLLELI